MNKKTQTKLISILLSLIFIAFAVLALNSSNTNENSELKLTVLNIQSYPQVESEWTVRFTTSGKANLTIKAIEGTKWSDESEMSDLKLSLPFYQNISLLIFDNINLTLLLTDITGTKISL